MNSENRTVNRIFNHKTVSASDIGKIDSVFQGRNMILYPAHECRYIIEFDSFGLNVENQYVHKTSIIGKLSKLNDDFDQIDERLTVGWYVCSGQRKRYLKSIIKDKKG